MKRIGAWMAVCIFLFMGIVPSYGGEFLEYGSVEMTDALSWEAGTYTTVGLTFGGNDVETDVPGILYVVKGKTRTLVPVNMIKGFIDAQINWNQEKRQVSIVYGNKTLVLEIDKAQAFMNGKPYKLPNGVPAKLLTYKGITRTMVPVNILKEFGLEYSWSGENRTVEINYPKQSVKDVEWDESGRFSEIHIKTTGEVLTTSYFLDGSKLGQRDKIIVDLHNTDFNLPSYKVKDGKRIVDFLYGDVKKIKAYALSKEEKTRIEIEVQKRKGYDVFYDKEGEQIVVRFINSVRDVRTEEIYSTPTVVVNTGEDPAYNVIRLKDKVVVDVVNALMKYKDGNYDVEQVNSGGVKTIAYSQYDPSGDDYYEKDDIISRIVVNLDANTSVDDVFVESIANEIFIYVSGDPLDGFDYVKNGLDGATLSMEFEKAGEVESKLDTKQRLLTLSVDANSVDLSDMDVSIEDSIVERIAIESREAEGRRLISIVLSEGTRVVNLPGNKKVNGLLLSFANDNLRNSIWRNTLIAIDAGHGGSDPGAVGTKISESALTLRASKTLKRRLESLGFKTYMIRDADVKIAPSYRKRVANDIGADLVVSIHFNASENPDARGVEVLYANESTGRKKKFAQILQRHLVKTLRSVDRGIVHRPNLYMCRVPTMPSVLIELGFVTNAQEQERVMTRAFMESAAEGIVSGILEFLK